MKKTKENNLLDRITAKEMLMDNLIFDKNSFDVIWSNAGLDFPFSEWKLLQQIKLAKIWSVVEFLDNNADILDADTLLEILSGLAEKLYMLC